MDKDETGTIGGLRDLEKEDKCVRLYGEDLNLSQMKRDIEKIKIILGLDEEDD